MTSQLQVINKILQTGDFSLVTLNNLTEDYFFNYRAEFNYLKTHYETYGKIPDKLTFVSAFPDFDIVDTKEPDNYLLEQLIKDYNTSYLALRFNDIKKMLESGDTNKAVDYFLHSVDNLHRGSALNSTDIISNRSRYDRYLDRTADQSKYYIHTGFPELDVLIGGIDRENENMVIAARTGIGKSWTLIKMAAEASKQGLCAGIYSGEMTVDKVGYRIDTLLGHIDNKGIMRGQAYIQKQYKQYMDNLPSMGYGPIKVLTPADIAGPATVEALRAFIEKEHLDILFVDQYSLLEDTSHAQKSYERVANISKSIKNLQVMKKIPIISVSQMNRTKNEDDKGNDIQDTTQIGLSDRIGQDATIVLMLSRKDDQLIINVVKSRDGGDDKKLTYKADFNLGQFQFVPEEMSDDDSTKMKNSYSSEGTNPF